MHLSDDRFFFTFAGVTSVSIDVGKEEVLVECALTSAEVQALIESTGRRAVLKGIGGSEQGEKSQDGSEAFVLTAAFYAA